MALKKTTPASFEQEPGVATQEERTETVTKTVVQTDAPKDEPKVDAAAAASAAAATTIAKASATSTSVSLADAKAGAKKFQEEVQAMKGASDFSYGNYRVFKGNNGEIRESNGEEESLGRYAQVRLMSWDEHYEISPGEQGKETKDFVAYSKDGKTVDSVIGEELVEWVGRSVDDYVEYLRKEEEFSKAKVRKFVDTACALLATDSTDGPIGSVIQITLSESSIPSFSRYQQELMDKARAASMGIRGFSIPEDPFTFFFIREAAKKGDNSWTKLKISSDLPVRF